MPRGQRSHTSQGFQPQVVNLCRQLQDTLVALCWEHGISPDTRASSQLPEWLTVRHLHQATYSSYLGHFRAVYAHLTGREFRTELARQITLPTAGYRVTTRHLDVEDVTYAHLALAEAEAECLAAAGAHGVAILRIDAWGRPYPHRRLTDYQGRRREICHE